MREFLEVLQASGSVIAFLAGLLGVSLTTMMAAKAARAPRRVPTDSLQDGQDRSERDQLELQIADIRNHLRKQENRASVYGLTSMILNISQYGVGAALVTSFGSENLSSQGLGLLGVVTLLSSFSQQLARPDVKRSAAAQRALRLQEMLRRAEIALAETSGHAGMSQLRIDHAKSFLRELHALQLDGNGGAVIDGGYSKSS